jgi:hypothetical protein
MTETKSVERWFDGCPFPIWVILDSEFAKQHPSFAVHILKSSDGTADLPLFTTEAKALSYIANFPLAGHEPSPIENEVDLRISLEVFRKRNGAYVRIDDPDGRTEGIFCPTLDSFISLLPSSNPTKS